jgi:hypothetical protein
MEINEQYETNEQFEAKMKALGIPKIEGLIDSKWIDGKWVAPDNAAEINSKILDAALNLKPKSSEAR